MGFLWKNIMNRRLQDVEIRRYIDYGADNFPFSAYGGLTTTSPSQEYTYGAGFQHYVDFDTAPFSAPRGVNVDLAGNRMAIENLGVYLIPISFSMAHNELNNGRTFSLRLFNQTDGVAGPSVVIGIGRNTPNTNFATVIPLEPGATGLGDFWIIQIGGASQVITATFNAFSWTIFSIGPAQQTIQT